jgi:protocatechuate 3,4-dioxygenase beta subunit
VKAVLASLALVLGGSPEAHTSTEAAPTERDGSIDSSANLSWSTRIAPENEPGEPLVMRGTIFQEDGKTPAKDVILYVYHTNDHGIYPRTTPDDGTPRWRHGTLRGSMKTGEDGRYEFRTIRPARYPTNSAPAHIHATITAPGIPEYRIDDFLFEGDPLLTEDARRGHGRGGFPHVIRLTRDADGVWQGTRDIRVQRGLHD